MILQQVISYMQFLENCIVRWDYTLGPGLLIHVSYLCLEYTISESLLTYMFMEFSSRCFYVKMSII